MYSSKSSGTVPTLQALGKVSPLLLHTPSLPCLQPCCCVIQDKSLALLGFSLLISKTWAMKLNHKEGWRIDAFKLWCWRRLLRVPGTARRSNLSILKEIIPEYSLEGLILKLKLQYFGQLIWRVDSLEKTLLLGKIEGKRRRGWQTNSMDKSLSKLKEIVKDRGAWCAAVHGVSPWSHKEANTTWQLNNNKHIGSEESASQAGVRILQDFRSLWNSSQQMVKPRGPVWRPFCPPLLVEEDSSLHDLSWVPKGGFQLLLIKGGATEKPPEARLKDQD